MVVLHYACQGSETLGTVCSVDRLDPQDVLGSGSIESCSFTSWSSPRAALVTPWFKMANVDPLLRGDLLYPGSSRRFRRRYMTVDLQACQLVAQDEGGEMPRAHLRSRACFGKNVACFFPVGEMASSSRLDNALAIILSLLLDEISGP